MPLIQGVLEKALQESRISRREWEEVLEHATLTGEVIREGENSHLLRLVSLLEGGEVTVEGVPQSEILRRLAVFA
jgi:hypothetical protein